MTIDDQTMFYEGDALAVDTPIFANEEMTEAFADGTYEIEGFTVVIAEGKISELTRSNFFIVDKDNTIITPGDGILKGVNRKHVITLASQHFSVVERDLFMDELATAREAFITGTTKKVMPVYQVDDMFIGKGTRGPVTEELQKLYDNYLREYMLYQS